MNKKELKEKLKNIPKDEILYQRYNGKINKYIDNGGYYINCETGIAHKKYDNIFLGKTSKNIIDLIEEGDYINGSEVIRVFSNSITVITKYGLQSYTFKEINQKKYGSIINSIVTKEQFAQMEYIVKE